MSDTHHSDDSTPLRVALPRLDVAPKIEYLILNQALERIKGEVNLQLPKAMTRRAPARSTRTSRWSACGPHPKFAGGHCASGGRIAAVDARNRPLRAFGRMGGKCGHAIASAMPKAVKFLEMPG